MKSEDQERLRNFKTRLNLEGFRAEFRDTHLTELVALLGRVENMENMENMDVEDVLMVEEAKRALKVIGYQVTEQMKEK